MKKIPFALPLLSLALLFAGCGGKQESAAPAPVDPPGVKVLRLSADDTMRYSATAFEVQAGESVRVVFTNKGSMPKQAMAHNWVLLKPCADADVNAFGIAAGSAAPTYIPADKAAQIVVHTKLLGPGESDAVDFKAPAAGEYPFLCSFPGHFALMKGKLNVK